VNDWQTSEIPARKSEITWKKYLGEACPHGLELVAVDGTHVRNTYDSDFVQGGNGFRYRFVPKGELWIDEQTPESEWPLVAFHECYETELMRGGMDYESAHTRAKLREDRIRHSANPMASVARAQASMLEEQAVDLEERGLLREAGSAYGRAAMLREHLGQCRRATQLRVLAIQTNRPGPADRVPSSMQHPAWRSR